MAILYVVAEVDMVYLKRKTGITWGNLSSHVSKLEEADYLVLTKEIVDKKMKTTICITERGREEFETYRHDLAELLDIQL